MSVKVKVVDKDLGWAAMTKRVKQAKDGRVKVGVLAADQKGEQDRGGITNAELAVILHFGAPNAGIPARPFLSMAFDQHREPLAKMGAELMGKVILGEVSLDKALGLMGAKLAAESKKTITVGSQLTPNAPATVAKKGSDRPLVDTGRLLNSITWAIEKEH